MNDGSNHLFLVLGQRAGRARGVERKILSLPAAGVMNCEPVTDQSGR